MNRQEVFNQIEKLQKQRETLREHDAHLVLQIIELRNKLNQEGIKKGYYTDKYHVFCRVYDIKENSVFTYALDTEALCLSKEVYSCEIFRAIYQECTKEEYNNALDKIIKCFKD